MTSFNELNTETALNEVGFYTLVAEPPTYDPPLQELTISGVTEVSGVYHVVYEVVTADLTPEEIATVISNKKKIMWDRIKVERDRRKASGVKAGENWFHSDADSRIQQIGLVLLGANIPPGLNWKTLTNGEPVFVPMTQALALQIFQNTALTDPLIFAAAEAHRTAMELLENPFDYDFSSGWPPSIDDE
jgi:hypothetical protein